MTTIPTQSELSALALDTARRCGVDVDALTGDVQTRSPINGGQVATLAWRDAAYVDEAVGRAGEAFLAWRRVPAPARGALVKRFGELLAEHKDDLAVLVSIEAGKITSEARGEIQEMIDICDFAVGLSRQLYGRTMPSERPGHRLMETWHPLGVVGVVSAFNSPAAATRSSGSPPSSPRSPRSPAMPCSRRRSPSTVLPRRSRRSCSAAPRW